MSALPLALARLSKLWIPFLSHLLYGDLCKNFFDFHIFFFSSFQSWFCHTHWFYPCHGFKHSNWWRYKLGHT